MRVFLDDERATPAGWIRVYEPSQAIDLLETGAVRELSLGHDLGDDRHGTGYDVVRWIEEAVVLRGFRPPRIFIHSANPSAREKMLACIRSIERYYRDSDATDRSDHPETSAGSSTAALLRTLHSQLAETSLDVPPGWVRLVNDLVASISDRARETGTDSAEVRYEQVKSKFAELRCHIEAPFELTDLIGRAWLRSTLTCERCGAIGKLRMRRPLVNVRTTCERCESEAGRNTSYPNLRTQSDLPKTVQMHFQRASNGWVEVIAKTSLSGSDAISRTRSLQVHQNDIALSIAHLFNKEQAIAPHTRDAKPE